MKIKTYRFFKEKMNSYMNKIIKRYGEKDEKAIEKLYNKIEKLENKNTHFAAKFEEEIFSH